MSEELKERIEFSVTTSSRHPQNLNAYDPLEHQYKEEYVPRSYQSGPSLAAADSENPTLGVVITFLNFARSGASIDEGLLEPGATDDWTELGQIEEAKCTVGERPITAD